MKTNVIDASALFARPKLPPASVLALFAARYGPEERAEIVRQREAAIDRDIAAGVIGAAEGSAKRRFVRAFLLEDRAASA